MGDKRQGPFSLPSGDGKPDKALWDPQDPGSSSYPEDPKSAKDEMVGSDDMSEHFYDGWMWYRENNGADGMFHDKTAMDSIARVHSQDMHEHDYVGVDAPDGTKFAPERYKDTQTSCEAVDRMVYTYSTTVVNANGTRTDVTSETVSAEMFAQMLDDDKTKQKLMQSDYNAAGVGFYVASYEADDGSVVADVYLTLDFCSGFQHDRFHG